MNKPLDAAWIAELLTAVSRRKAVTIGTILLEDDDAFVRMKSDVLPLLPIDLSEAIQNRAIIEPRYDEI